MLLSMTSVETPLAAAVLVFGIFVSLQVLSSARLIHLEGETDTSEDDELFRELLRRLHTSIITAAMAVLAIVGVFPEGGISTTVKWGVALLAAAIGLSFVTGGWKARYRRNTPRKARVFAFWGDTFTFWAFIFGMLCLTMALLFTGSVSADGTVCSSCNPTTTTPPASATTSSLPTTTTAAGATTTSVAPSAAPPTTR